MICVFAPYIFTHIAPEYKDSDYVVRFSSKITSNSLRDELFWTGRKVTWTEIGNVFILISFIISHTKHKRGILQLLWTFIYCNKCTVHMVYNENFLSKRGWFFMHIYIFNCSLSVITCSPLVYIYYCLSSLWYTFHIICSKLLTD